MNINDLTIGQAKELVHMFESNRDEHSALQASLIGSYVIIRSRNEGVNAGYLAQADSSGCVLTDARRLWKPISKDRSLSWYEGVAVSGLGDKSSVSGIVTKKVIIEDYSITECSSVATQSIKEFKSNGTTY